MVDVILVHPRLEQEKRGVLAENLGLGYIAAMLRTQGVSTEILDGYVLQLNSDQLVQEILNRSPSVIGICVLGQSLAETVSKIIEELRENDCQAHICLGHHFPSLAHRDLLLQMPLIDSIVRGEGEYAFLELVNALASNHSLDGINGLTFRQGDIIQVNPDRSRIDKLDALPYPARDTLPVVLQNTMAAQILGSRGCYYDCSFCSIVAFLDNTGRTLRDPEIVVDEIASVIRDYNCSFFRFSDDNFVDRGLKYRAWAFDLCDQIEKKNLKMSFRINCRADCIDKELFARLKSVGLWEVATGIEAGSPDILNNYNKRSTVQKNIEGITILQELGIRPKIGYILFDPFADIDQTYRSLLFLNGYRSNSLKGYYRKAEPFTGTPLREQMIREGLLKASSVWEMEPYLFQDRAVDQLYYLTRPLRHSIKNVNRYVHLFKNSCLWQLENLHLVEPQKIDASLAQFIVKRIDSFIAEAEDWCQETLEKSFLKVKSEKTQDAHAWQILKSEWEYYEQVLTEEAEVILGLLKDAESDHGRTSETLLL